MKQKKERDIRGQLRLLGQICLGIMGMPYHMIDALLEDRRFVSDNGGVTYSLDGAPQEWRDMVARFEEQNDVYVYHVVFSSEWFGDCLNLLYICKEVLADCAAGCCDEGVSEALIEILGQGVYRVWAGVNNLTSPEYSDVGSIILTQSGTGLCRIDGYSDICRSRVHPLTEEEVKRFSAL